MDFDAAVYAKVRGSRVGGPPQLHIDQSSSASPIPMFNVPAGVRPDDAGVIGFDPMDRPKTRCPAAGMPRRTIGSPASRGPHAANR